LRKQVDDVLMSLNDCERETLMLCFGRKDGYSRTLEEMGQIFQVMLEYVRQIKAKVLIKMRHSTRLRELHVF
jgi:RNA polymerase primary sigma factor